MFSAGLTNEEELMTDNAVASNHTTDEQSLIREITLDDPWQWLAAGWKDLRTCPVVSLSYGLFFVAFSYLLTFALIWWDMFYFLPPLVAGYFLVAPVLGIGLYSVSRSLERGEPVTIRGSLAAWRENETQVAAMGLMLMMLFLIWFLVAILVFALFFHKPIPTWENFVPVLFLSGDSPLFLFAGVFSGAIIAGFVFSVAAVSVPMLFDRPVNALFAVRTSLMAVRANWQPMLLWASLLVLFAGSGLATFYFGLALWFPLVGHATWHAYRAVVAPDVTPPATASTSGP